MAGKTTYYSLSLPEAWDSQSAGMIRADHGALDEAINRIEAATGGLSLELEHWGYNLYNLMLQDYYEGKYTGYKKALIFDGFSNSAEVESVTTGMWVDSVERVLRLNGAGQQQSAVNFAPDAIGTLMHNKLYTEHWRATGYGTLTKVEIYYQGSAFLRISQGETVLATVECDQPYEKQTAVFSVSVPVTPGAEYNIALMVGDSNLTVHTAGTKETQFGFRLTFTPKRYTSGTMVSTPFPTVGSFEKILAWVRYQGCTPTLSLKAGSRSLSLAHQGTASCVNLQGVACQERSYAYTGTAASGPVTVTLALQGSSGTEGYVYDYGLILL